jgi:hypothetical protein
MHRSNPTRTSGAGRIAVAFCACVAVLAVPRPAAADLASLHEIHEIRARGTLNGETTEELVPGNSELANPVNIQVVAPGSISRLNLAFDGRAVTGALRSDSGFNPRFPGAQIPSETLGTGHFGILFSVDEPTPFSLHGHLSAIAGPFSDIGAAGVTLTEDDTFIYTRESSYSLIPGQPVSVDFDGTLQPGRNYAFGGSVSGFLTPAAHGQVQASGGYVNFTLTLPEPASVALLAPGAALLLARRRRTR